MKIDIAINNLAQAPLKNSWLERSLRQTLKSPSFNYLQGKNIEISLAIVSPQEIKNLNKTYRGLDKVTDILSFAEYKEEKDIKASEKQNLFLGELVLCYDDVKEYAQTKNLDLRQELAKVTSHGLLHLLGWQHSKKMFQYQTEVSKQIK